MSITDLHNPWRDRLRPASFRSATFHMDVIGRAGGRRIVEHEYPKRDDPNAEDMGRHARRFTVAAYVIGPNYQTERDVLIEALEAANSGTFIHPLQGEFEVVVERFTQTEDRERGGYSMFDIQFAEAGVPAFNVVTSASPGVIGGAANDAEAAAAVALNQLR